MQTLWTSLTNTVDTIDSIVARNTVDTVGNGNTADTEDNVGTADNLETRNTVDSTDTKTLWILQTMQTPETLQQG